MLNVEDIISNWKVNLPVRAQSCLEHFASNLERYDLRGHQITVGEAGNVSKKMLGT